MIKTSNVLVSVIIPVYNVEQYVRKCIDSVIVQTYKEIEIILVDDGSTDKSPLICDEYALSDNRIKVIHQDNGGLSRARNVGFSNSHGKYVYFLDSDDFIAPNAIEVLLKEAEANSAEVILFDAYVVDEFDNLCDPSENIYQYIRKGTYPGVMSGQEIFAQMLSNREYRSTVPMIFINRNSLLEYGLSFSEGILHEDELFTFLLLMQSVRVMHIRQPLFYRRMRSGSIMTSHKTHRNFSGIFAVLAGMMEYCNNHTLIPSANEAASKYMAKLFCAAAEIYEDFDSAEKRKIKNEKQLLFNQAKKMQYYKDKKVSLICRNQALYRLYNISKKYIHKSVRDKIRGFIGSKKMQNYDKDLAQLKETYGQNRLIIIGTPTHGNLGDHAITEAEIEFFKDFIPNRHIVEINMPFYLCCKKRIAGYITQNDIVFVSGGGWLGNLWQHNENAVRSIIETFKNNKVVILPQTVYFEDNADSKKEIDKSKKIYSAHKNLLFCLREQKSYEFAKKHILTDTPENCMVMPDMVLYLNKSKFDESERKGVLLCFREDRERQMDNNRISKLTNLLTEKGEPFCHTTTVYHKNIPLNERGKELEMKYDEFRHVKLVITDRLHAMIFSAITGTPCIAFNNVTGKVKGVFSWIEYLGYVRFVSTETEAENCLVELLNMGNCRYDNTPLLQYYNNLFRKIIEK